ncbi:anti-sigma factor [Phenylobacterium sp. 20VBR1]|uniref:Anti-sigma factor n=1 Tax=Phenylobacterium glaciei TaxID=2803784 RepID=A0A941D1F5_9CAUL|nr:anti-sigma factor [Phenylobacterium glaciei]MBR7619664.1 anti-sigma factor [Phenylobacterium glaciei]
MKIDDRKLIAYVDGELDAFGRAEVEAAVAADPVLGVRLEEHRLLRAKVGGAYAGVAQESVPAQLMAAAQAGAKAGNVVKLADRRKPPPVAKPQIKLALPAWSSVAATLMVGVVAGYVISQQNAGVLAPSMDGALVARGALAKALDSNLSASSGPARLGISFKTADGRYCRTFQADAQRIAGIACHEGPRWIARMTTAAPAPTKAFDYRTAASATAPAVLAAVDGMIEGEPLDRAGEITAKARRWRN